MNITEFYLYRYLTSKYFCINVKHHSLGSGDLRECSAYSLRLSMASFGTMYYNDQTDATFKIED
jgi:hypothetical protein